jgi:hypothetical protein
MNARRTYLTYFGFLFILLLVVGYSARNVLFRPWTARSWVTSTTVDSRIFLFGGKDPQNDLMKNLLVVDPGADTLKRFGGQPDDLFGSSAASLNGRIYVAGGTDNRTITDRIERFDPAVKRLVPIGRLPGPRVFGGMVTSDGYLFYLGGWDGKKTSDDIIRIDPNTGNASVVAHLPAPLEQFAHASMGGTVYLIGGLNQAGDFLRSIYALDPRTGAVVARGTLDAPAARMSAAVVDGSVYVTGGWNGNELSELVRIERSGAELTARGVIAITYPILDAAMSSVNGKLYLIGGKEERYGRQIQVLKINPQSGDVTSLVLKSYAWW